MTSIPSPTIGELLSPEHHVSPESASSQRNRKAPAHPTGRTTITRVSPPGSNNAKAAAAKVMDRRRRYEQVSKNVANASSSEHAYSSRRTFSSSLSTPIDPAVERHMQIIPVSSDDDDNNDSTAVIERFRHPLHHLLSVGTTIMTKPHHFNNAPPLTHEAQRDSSSANNKLTFQGVGLQHDVVTCMRQLERDEHGRGGGVGSNKQLLAPYWYSKHHSHRRGGTGRRNNRADSSLRTSSSSRRLKGAEEYESTCLERLAAAAGANNNDFATNRLIMEQARILEQIQLRREPDLAAGAVLVIENDADYEDDDDDEETEELLQALAAQQEQLLLPSNNHDWVYGTSSLQEQQQQQQQHEQAASSLAMSNSNRRTTSPLPPMVIAVPIEVPASDTPQTTSAAAAYNDNVTVVDSVLGYEYSV